MNMRMIYLIMGINFLIISGYILFDSLNVGYSASRSLITIISLTILFFSLSYLQPQIKQKDERIKLIRQKSFVFSTFLLMIYLVISLVLLNLNVITLNSTELIQILSGLIIITISLMMVILSKLY